MRGTQIKSIQPIEEMQYASHKKLYKHHFHHTLYQKQIFGSLISTKFYFEGYVPFIVPFILMHILSILTSKLCHDFYYSL